MSITAGQSSTIPFSYTSSATSALGIYHVDYALLDASGSIIQPQAEADSGRFVASSPPAQSISKPLTFSVTAPTERFLYGSNATFTWHIWNNSDTERTVTVRYGFPHHTWETKDPSYGEFQNLFKTLTVPAKSEVTFTHTIVIKTEDQLFSNLFDENNILLGQSNFKIFRVYPSVNVSTQTDKTLYAKGETVSINASLKNNIPASWQSDAKITITDPQNTKVFEDLQTVNLTPNGAGTITSSLILPTNLPIGTYTVRVEAWYGTRLVSSAFKSFDLPQSQISVTPKLPPAFSSNNIISFTLNNKGSIGVSNGTLDVVMKDPDGLIMYSAVQPFTLSVGEGKTLNIPISIPSVKLGNYTLTYTQSDETRTGSPTTITIPSILNIAFTFDKPSYKVRDMISLTINLANNGSFNLDNISVAVSVPDAGYTDTKLIDIGQGQAMQLQNAILIPDTIIAGGHNVNVTLTLSGGSPVVQSAKFTIPESNLTLTGPTTTQFTAGDTINLMIENVGGVDTTYTTERLSITDNRGVVIYQGNVLGIVLAGEKKTFIDIQIPSQTANSLALLNTQIKDSKTLGLSNLSRSLGITGLTAGSQARTDKDIYLKTEAITWLSTILNGQFGINGGISKFVVGKIKPSGTGPFAHFLPKTGWWPLNFPAGAAIGPDGSVYVADTNSNRIQRFDSNGNFIMKWGSIGSGNGQFLSPRGIAVAPDGSVYVADTQNNRIQKFDSNGNFVTKWDSFGHSNGQFIAPQGIAIASDGSVYVADTSNNRIQRFDSNGNFITKWGSGGTGNGQFIAPQGIAIASDGSVYVTDTFNYRIQKFSSNGNFITKWGSFGNGDGQFSFPRGIAIASDGSVYVTDTNNNRIQKFTSNGVLITKWGSFGHSNGQFWAPQGIGIAPDGFIYVADTINSRIQRFDSNGNFIMKWGSSGVDDGQFSSPRGMAIAPDGSIYIVDNFANRIQKFDSNGNFIMKWGSGGTGDGQFIAPQGIATAPDGSVYVVDTLNNRVQKFDSNGAFIAKWDSLGSGDGQFIGPQGIAIASDGSVYVADTNNNRIQRFDSNGNFITKWGSGGTGDGQFIAPQGIATAPDGSVYVVDTFNYRIQKFSSNGNFITKWGSFGSGNGQFSFPRGIAIASDGSVYVTDSFNNRVQKFDSNGAFIAKWDSLGSGDGQFIGPSGIIIGPDSTVYVTETGNHRIQRMAVSIGGLETLFESALPITQSANITQEYATNIGTLNTTGKLLLQATLTNSLGQTIAISEYPFYIIEGNTVLLFNTDKKVYKPGETVTITGEVRNLAAISLDNALLTLSSGNNIILNQTITVPAGSSYPFTVTQSAVNEGTVDLTGKIIQNISILAEITDQYEVVGPKISASVSAPDIVDRNPFDMNLEIKNTGKVGGSLQLSVVSSQGNTIDNQQIIIPAGETKLLQYTRQITNSTTYTFTLAGDLNQTIAKAVVYGEAANISVTSGSVYPEGKVGIPVTITNTGLVAESIGVNYQLTTQNLQPATQVKTYYLSAGASTTDTLYFDLTKGDYQLTAMSQMPQASAQVSFKAAKENDVAMTATIGVQQTNGLIPTDVNLTNNGWNTINGSVQLSVVSGQGTAVWNGSQGVSLSSSLSPAPYTLNFNINPSAIQPGNYTVKVELINNSGQQLALSNQPLTIKGPIFQITQLPPYQTFTVGQEGAFIFTIKNTGSQEGEMILNLKAMDILDQTVTEWLKPGEEKELIFVLFFPDDLEEKDYFAGYELKGQGSGVNGQIKFHLSGVKLSVSAALDKQYYNTGDIALLSLDVSNLNPQTQAPNLFARVNYGDYEENRPFTVSGTSTLTFSIPLTQITGEKLFYGIYHESGRSIHLNSLYIYSAGDAITITTDKQVYNPGETILATVSSPQPAVTGTLTLIAPGYEETFSFAGTVAKSFTLPNTMTAGTYYISYQLTANGSQFTGTHPFDVAGIQVKVKEANLDKAKYASIDTMDLSLTIESNQNLSATLRAWIVDPHGNYTKTGDQGLSLTSASPLLTTHNSSLTTSKMGIHRLVYGIYHGNMLLSSGSEGFDVGDAALLGISTDKVDYPNGNETVMVASSLYGTVSAALEIFLDGVSVRTESLSLNGFSTHTSSLTNISPGLHAIKGVLRAGGLTSSKEISFIYGSNLPDLVIQTLSARQGSTTTYKLEANVINQGMTASIPSVITFYDGNPSSGASQITSFNLPTMGRSKGAIVSYDWNILGKAGTHTIYAIVDPGNTVVEWIETNNTKTFDITIPNLILALSTTESSYMANQNVGILFNMANLTPSITYQGLKLITTIITPQGEAVLNNMNDASILPPASTATYASNWNTRSLAPGNYTIKGKLMETANILAEGSTVFSILPTPSLVGDFTLSKDIVIQGHDLKIDYALTNNGNINLTGGEVKLEFILINNQSSTANFNQAFGAIQVLKNISNSIIIDKLEIEPGDYNVRLTAVAEGLSFTIGEKSLKILPPLEVRKDISQIPRILILLDKAEEREDGKIGDQAKKKDTKQEMNETIIRESLNHLQAYYQIVREKKAFEEAMRSGIYNIYILIGKGPLEDHLDEEMVERINSGEGLIMINYEKIEDEKFKEVTGIKAEGYLPEKSRVIDLLESPITQAGTVAIAGKMQKLEIKSSQAIIAGSVKEKEKDYPAIILNTYGKGKVAIFAFDFGESAMTHGSTAPYSPLLSSTITYIAPQDKKAIPGYPLPVEIDIKSIGADFNIRVKEAIGSDLPILLTDPQGKMDEIAITWEFTINKDEERRFLYIVLLPEKENNYLTTTKVEYLRNGIYQDYNTYLLAITTESLTSLEMRIFTQLQIISGKGIEEITEKYQKVINMIVPNMEKEEIQEVIHILLKVIRELKELNTDTETIRLDLDDLLKILERKWVDAQEG